MLDIKPFGSGDLPQEITTIYECPAEKNALVKQMSFHNKSAARHRFVVYIKRVADDDPRIFADHDIGAQHTSMLSRHKVIPLGPGDSIQAQSVDGTDLFDYDIAGAEEDILATT